MEITAFNLLFTEEAWGETLCTVLNAPLRHQGAGSVVNNWPHLSTLLLMPFPRGTEMSTGQRRPLTCPKARG